MNTLDDEWVSAHSPIPAEKLHALGVISFQWNIAEVSLKSLLAVATGINFANLWAIVHEMGDTSICGAIETIVKNSQNASTPFGELILHALEVYDVNRLNRNQLTHFIPNFDGSDMSRLKGGVFQPEPIPNSVEDLRRVATEIKSLVKFLSELTVAIGTRTVRDGKHPPPGEFAPLPDTIPVPKRLWKPLPLNQQEQNTGPDKAPGGNSRPPSAPRLTEVEWLAKYRKDGRPLPDRAN